MLNRKRLPHHACRTSTKWNTEHSKQVKAHVPSTMAYHTSQFHNFDNTNTRCNWARKLLGEPMPAKGTVKRGWGTNMTKAGQSIILKVTVKKTILTTTIVQRNLSPLRLQWPFFLQRTFFSFSLVEAKKSARRATISFNNSDPRMLAMSLLIKATGFFMHKT